ncbi:MAG: flippase [Planctomycetota bacterium]
MEQEQALTDSGQIHQLNEDELTTIAQGAGVTFVGKIAGGGIQYLYAIIVARMLGAKLFGLFMLGMTIINLATVVCTLGLNVGTVRFVTLYNTRNDNDRIRGTIVQSLKWSVLMSIFTGILLFLTAGLLSVKVFDKPELERTIKLLSVTLPFMSAAMIALAATQGFRIMKYTVYIQGLFLPLSSLVLAVIFFLAQLRFSGIIMAHVISVILTCTLSMIFLVKTFPDMMHILTRNLQKEKPRLTVSEIRRLLRFSMPLFLVIFLNFVINWTDTMMLGHFGSSAEVGIYNMAIKTAWLTSLILVSFNTIFAPTISILYSTGEMQKLESLYKTVTRWILTGSILVFLLILLLSKEIMAIFGPGFIVGWVPLVILAFAQLANAGVGSVAFMLSMSDRQNLVMWNTIGVCVLNIVLNYLLIPSMGMLGASIASSTSLITFNLVMLLEVYVLLKIHPYNRKFLTVTLLAIVTFAACLLVKAVLANWAAVPKLLICIPLFALVFMCLIYKWSWYEEDRFIVCTIKEKIRRTNQTSNKQG